MVNLSDSVINVSSNATELLSNYPIKPEFSRYVLVITLLFVGLGLLLFFFSKFNYLLTKK